MNYSNLYVQRLWGIGVSDSGFDFDCNELMDSLEKAIKKYPDKAEERLITISNRFKKDVIEETKKTVKEHTGRLIKGYKLDKVKGYGANIQRDFRGTAPHFHLIENGHEIVDKNGIKRGFAEGKHIVKNEREKYADYVMPFEMQKLLDDITKECGLD